MLNKELVKEHFKYQDGHLWWTKKYSNMSRITIGTRFGTFCKGYVRGTFAGKLYYEHRLIWFYHYGDWPMYIDHINGDRSDNAIENLRVATVQQNGFNRGGSTNTTSKYKGVYWNKRQNKWHSRCRSEGKQVHLGFFDLEHDAAIAYDKFAENIHGCYVNPNFKGD